MEYTTNQIIEVEVQGLKYQCPPLPKPNSIRRSSKKQEDQVWHRNLTYEQWDWNIDPKEGDLWYDVADEEQWAYFHEEIHRIHYGEWIMINGVPTYFNADTYFFHQWFCLLIEGIYPVYKDTTLESYRFMELCENDPLCLGDVEIKGRRLGFSSMRASRKLRISITEDNTLLGIVSKTGTDAYEMYLMVKNGLEKLPGFLTPEINKVTESEIHIAKQTSRISKNNRFLSADKGKNNRVNWLDTAENAYDGRRVRDLTIDEAAKYERVNVCILLSKVSDTLLVGGSVGGYVSVISTVNKGDKGGDNFKKIWDGSDHTNTKNGMTATRLKRGFIEGYRGFYGYVGKYGESIIDTPTPEQRKYLETFIDPSTGKRACPDPTIGAREWLQRLRDLVANDPEQYAEQVRKYPFKWQEVFRDANNMCHFNIEELNDQRERLGAKLEYSSLYRVGHFVNQNGNITFRDVPNPEPHRFYWYVLDLLPPEESNKHTWQYGQKCPLNTGYGAGGADLIMNTEKTAEKGSDAAMVIFKRYNALDEVNSGMIVAFGIGRPASVLEQHEQLFNAAQYYGVKMLIERSPIYWYDYAEKNKLLGYCIKTKLKINGQEVYGIAVQDGEAREQHLTEMIEYASMNMAKIWFMRILDDMMEFNVKDRTLYDGCMAFGYALMGLKERYLTIVPDTDEDTKFRVYNLQAKYGRG